MPANIGFDDSMIYNEMTLAIPDRRIPIIPVGREGALKFLKPGKIRKTKKFINHFIDYLLCHSRLNTIEERTCAVKATYNERP
jgi:hypothetical protein